MQEGSGSVNTFQARPRLVLALILAVSFGLHLIHLTGNNHQDLFIYCTGAELGLRGGSPYDTNALRQRVREQYPTDARLAENCGFFLAPQAVVVFAPFASFPWPLGKTVWSLLVYTLAGLAIAQFPVFSTDPDRVRRYLPLVAAGVLLNPLIVTTMAVGQTSLFLWSCVVLGQVADQAGWRRLAGFLWAVPFIKPHLALPLLPLAWYLGGWRRAAELVLWVAGLNLLGGLLSTGSPWLLRDYLAHLAGSHQAVEFNQAALNYQITSWNRLLVAWGGPAIELSALSTLASYAVFGLLVLARVGLAGSRPTSNWAFAVAMLAAVVCCQLLAYELILLGLLLPHVFDLAAEGRRREVAVLLGLLAFVSVPLEVMQALTAAIRPGPWLETVMLSHKSLGVALLTAAVLGFGWGPNSIVSDAAGMRRSPQAPP